MKKYTISHEKKEAADSHMLRIIARGGKVKKSEKGGLTTLEYSFPEKGAVFLKGLAPKYISPLIIDFADFCKEQLNISDSTAIDINFKKIPKDQIGFVNFGKIIKGQNEITIDRNAGFNVMLSYIAHEMTHVMQIQKKKLAVKDWYFWWNGEKNISTNDYNSIVSKKNISAYNQLPWEKEAYRNQETFVKKYIESDNFSELKMHSKEPNLKFILDYSF